MQNKRKIKRFKTLIDKLATYDYERRDLLEGRRKTRNQAIKRQVMRVARKSRA